MVHRRLTPTKRDAFRSGSSPSVSTGRGTHHWARSNRISIGNFRCGSVILQRLPPGGSWVKTSTRMSAAGAPRFTSYRGIAEALNNPGVRSARGGQWQVSNVHNLLARMERQTEGVL